MKPHYTLALHGGAGTISRASMSAEAQKDYENALLTALEAGEQVLRAGGDALQAVQQTVVELENNPLFNAGKGAVFTHEGTHEMDASIMEGQFLKAGAVSGLKRIKNPVLLARKIMEEGTHVFLSGSGAEDFAKKNGLAFEDEAYFYVPLRYQQLQEALKQDKVFLDHNATKPDKFGTVGAVALDVHGNLAAATSTGGMTNKKHGRVGDTPIIGAGTYANNRTCAISCTGHGEFFIRAVVAYDISCLMEYKGLSLKEACRAVVHDKLVKLGGEGGLIAVDAKGNVELPFNSEGMYRGSVRSGETPVIAIYKS